MSGFEDQSLVDDELVSVYTDETLEQLLRLAVILRKLLADQDEQDNYREEMYRIAHTIKGSSEIVGIDSISQIMFEAEKLFASVDQGITRLKPLAISTLLDLTLELSTYLEDTFPAELVSGKNWVERVRKLVTDSTQLGLVQEKLTESIVETQRELMSEENLMGKWVKPGPVQPFLENLGKLTVVKDELLALYRRGGNTLTDWEQVGCYLETLEELTSGLREKALQLHLIPVEGLFLRVSQTCSQDIEVKFIGAELEINREMAGKLVQPLTALIRILLSEQANSSGSHGEQKRLVFKAERTEGVLSITVTVENAPQAYPRSGPNDSFMALASFKEIDEAIKKLQGWLCFDGTEGGLVKLNIPVFPQEIRGLIFKAGEQLYALPARNFNHNLTINKREIQKSGSMLFLLRYPEVIPLIDMEGDYSSSEELLVIIVACGRAKYGLLVKELMGYEEIIILRQEKPRDETRLVSGTALRRDGTVLILPAVYEIAQQINML